MKPILASLFLLLGACSGAPPAPDAGVPVEPAAPRATLNATCPRSGKPVAADSLTTYRGFVVGFCNPHCRDEFAADPEGHEADRAFFDALISTLD